MRVLWLGMLSVLGLMALFVATASAQDCPNEALRSELRSGRLPDCRAYELVTPVYKEGQTVESTVFAISEGGDHMIGTSFGNFAGAEESRLSTQFLGDAYEFSRTGSGWRTVSLGPPASAYLSSGMLDASADLSRSLWQLTSRPPIGSEAAARPENAQHASSVFDYYIEGPLGAFVDVGRPTPSPEVPNSNEAIYLGGSNDLSHLLFTTESEFHWPFDKTSLNAYPLYEYVGTRNAKPMLVGVSGGRESNELLSECGVLLGSGRPAPGGGSMYNAISDDGRRVFFTAVGASDQACGAEEPAVDELYVREELPSGEMFTAAISEPSIFYCSPPSPNPKCASATFEGASRDGARVYFSSAQKLLPGASEGAANLYEDELIGSGSTLTQRLILVSAGGATSGFQGVARVSKDGFNVYFVATGELTGAPNGQGYHAKAGEDNLYLFERNESHPEGHMAFIATLSSGDGQVWSREDIRPVLLSSNSRFLIFLSSGDLTHEGATGSQVYQYDSQTGMLVRASIGQAGYNNDGRTPVAGSTVRSYLPIGYPYSRRDSPTQAAGVLAPEDGAVFFESSDALTPQALSDQPGQLVEGFVPNIYEYRNGSVYLISDGHDISTVYSLPSVQLVGSSASGGDLFFSTADSLVAQDSDTQQDVYDARIEGGFPASTGALACDEEACRGALNQGPVLEGALAASVPEAIQPIDGKPKTKTKIKIRRKHGKTHKKRARRARTAASHGHRSAGRKPS